MKRKFTKLLAAFALLVFMTPSMVGWGQTDVTFVAGTDTGETSVTKDGVTVSMSTMSRTDNYRCYANSDMTVSSTAGNITSVVVTCTANGTSSNGPGKFSVATSSSGTYTYETDGPTGTWTGNASNMALTASAQVRMTQIVVTIGAASTFAVTYDCNGGTSGCPENVTGIASGTSITLADAPAKTDYTFGGWNDGTTTHNAGASYTVNGNVTMTAQWTANGGGGGTGGGNITFDFEDNTAHRTSGSNSYTGTNTYSENGATITLTYADAIITGSPLNGSANVLGRVKGSTTNSPVVLIGAINIGNKTITSISYDIKGVATMSQVFEYSLDNSNWSSLLSMESVPSSKTTKTVSNLNITGTNLYLRWTTSVSSSTTGNRDFQMDDIVLTYTEGGVIPDPSITISGTGITGNAITLQYNDTGNHTATVDAANFSGTPSLTVGRYTNAECTEPYNGSDFTAVLDNNTITYKFANANTSQTASRTYYLRVSSTSPAVNSNVITVTQGTVPHPSITISGSYTINVTTAETEDYKGFSYQTLPINDENDFAVQFYDANNNEIDDPDWIVAYVTTQPNETGYFLYYWVEANVDGPARTAYCRVYAMDDGDNLVYSNRIVIKQEKHKIPGAAGNWVETDFSALTANDIFVIVGRVGNDIDGYTYYAMSNDEGTGNAPVAVEVTIDNGQITSNNVNDNIQWNISGNSTDGFIFYPNDNDGSTWLYCTNSNNGVRVGTGNAKHFKFDDTYTDYLTTTETTAQRYIGIYNSQDWRCYTLTTSSEFPSNIEGQTFSFYKKVVTATPLNMDVDGFGNEEGGYYLIASPYMVNPAQIGMTNGDYDLYEFDQSKEGLEWRNYKAAPFYLVPGKGYLYAHKTDVEPNVVTGAPYAGNGVVSLNYTDGKHLAGWNLIGNPFTTNATLDMAFFRMNTAGDGFLSVTENSVVNATEGVFVQATAANQTATFTAQSRGGKQGGIAKANLNVIGANGTVIDNAIVRFDEGQTLEKFMLHADGTKIFFTEDHKDYAIVRGNAQGQMPVNFKAAADGTYTISVETENLDVDYLHLIDNMTGMDVDLLATPSYTFEGKKSDYASRFKLVFNANAGNNEVDEDFAFISDGNIIILNEGEATLQVIDIMGRIVSTQTVNGNASVNNVGTAGVYVLQLINGNNVKTQKIVVR